MSGPTDAAIFLTVTQAATLLGISDSMAWRCVHGQAEPRLPFVKIGGVYRVPRIAIDALVEQAMTIRPEEQAWAGMGAGMAPQSPRMLRKQQRRAQ